MSLASIFVITIVFLNTIHGFVQNETKTGFCDVNISKDIGKPSPLFIYPGTTTTIRAADSKGRLTFYENENIMVACPGYGNYVSVKGAGVSEVVATCLNGRTFIIDGYQYDINQIICKKWPAHVSKKRGICLWGKLLVKTGFDISTGFVEVFESCHDDSLHHTYYTRFILGRDVAGAQTGVARPNWEKGGFFGYLNPTDLYTRRTQRQTLGVILGSTALAEQYIHMTNDFFLSKGHMVAKGDFLHGAFQTATFWYINAAPQWQTFNGKNWAAIENDVRLFAARIGKDLEVYTGTYGRATLPDINANEVDLYLSTTKKIPVPRLYWKIIYDPTTLAAIAFIGLNNPYQSAESAAKDVFCRDICSTVSWLTWYQFDLVRGYSYCCEVNEFRANLPDIPSFPVTSILR